MSNFKTFCCKCVSCGGTTSKSYARANAGQCKVCVTGVARKINPAMLCPTCGERELTPYQKAHRYHCDSCTKEADPVGYYQELTTPAYSDY